MEKGTQIKSGAALTLSLLAIGLGTFIVHKFNEPQFDFLKLKAPNGQPGFALLVNAPAWRYLIDHSSLPTAEALNLKVSHDRINAVVAQGLHMDHMDLICPNWELVQVHPIPGGSVFLSGYCVKSDEIKQTRDETTL
jgi:hypothetical protein